MNTDYPLRFIKSAIDEFQKSNDHGNESFIIPICLDHQAFHIHWNILLWPLVSLDKNIFWRYFTNSVIMVSELQQRGKLEIYDLYFL